MKANEVTARLFCKAADHLIAQGQASYLGGGSTCAYRSPDGLKCAIGVLIDDGHYRGAFEGSGIFIGPDSPNAKAVRKAVRQSQSLASNEKIQWPIMIQLQSVHDGVGPHDWSEELSALASEYGIDWKPKQ